MTLHTAPPAVRIVTASAQHAWQVRLLDGSTVAVRAAEVSTRPGWVTFYSGEVGADDWPVAVARFRTDMLQAWGRL